MAFNIVPCATQYTNPEQADYHSSDGGGNFALPQADPNGLFSPASAEGTWVMLKDPAGDVKPQYIEPRIYVSTYKFPSD